MGMWEGSFFHHFRLSGRSAKSGVARGGAQNAQAQEATCIMERICDVAERAHETGENEVLQNCFETSARDVLAVNVYVSTRERKYM
jgi:hypothetical protein